MNSQSKSFHVAVLLSLSLLAPCYAVDLDQRLEFNIPAQPLSSALIEFSHQAEMQVVTRNKLDTLTTSGISGSYSIREALMRLLAPSGLSYRIVGSSSITIGKIEGEDSVARMRLSQAPMDDGDTLQNAAGDKLSSRASDVKDDADRAALKGIPEVFVTGSRLLNMDVVRTQDDSQPYRILDSEAIARSSASDVETFLKMSLTANTVARTNGQQNAVAIGNASSVNLRGLGTDSTLILINGRRAVGAPYYGENLQPDLNAIPLAAIERIEVLPAAASAIYGGAAMGGVVNVVLKSDFEGGEVKLRYDDTFSGHAPIRAVDVTFGTSFEDGRTNVLVAAHYSDAKLLVNADRPELLQAGVQRVLERSPGLLYSPTNPFLVGTTPNISSTDGSVLTLRDGTSLGSSFTHIPPGYNVGSDPAALVANAGSYNLTLPYTTNNNRGLLRPLGSAPEVISVMGVARRAMTDKLDMFAEFTINRNDAESIYNGLTANYTVPASAPTNPFQQTVRINIPDPMQNNPYTSEYAGRRAVLGFIYDLPAGWMFEGDYTWSSIETEVRSRFVRMTTALRTGVINPFVDTLAYPLDLAPYLTGGDSRPSFGAKSYMHDVGLRFVGRVGSLPAGDPVLTIGLGYRKEGMRAGRSASFAPGAVSESFDYVYLPQSQEVYSLYTEGLIPLVSAANRVPAIHELDLQLAVRSERFSVGSNVARVPFGTAYDDDPATTRYTSTNSTIGLRYEIVDGFTLRASLASAFLPPSYSQLLPGVLTTTGLVSILDPRRGNSLAIIPVIQGGNPNLEPEETDNLNVGIVLEPAFAPGLRLSADWFRFKQENVIIDPTFIQIVNNESAYPGRVTRAPVAPGDPWGIGEITLLDQTLINGTRAEIEGIDFGLSYVRNAGAFGTFQFNSAATLFRHYKVQNSLDSPLLDQVNEVANGGPLRFKLNASLLWDMRGWSAGWSTYYFGAYDQYDVGSDLYVLAQGSKQVPSQIYHDLFAGYRFGGAGRAGTGWGDLLDGVSVQVGVRNVFDKAAPFDAFYASPAYFSPFGDARMRSYSLSISKSFD